MSNKIISYKEGTILDENYFGKRILLLGSAEYGVTNEVLNPTTIGEMINTYGNKGTLISAYKSVRVNSPKATIFTLKTTGTHAVTYLNVNTSTEIIEDSFIIRSKESNENYNNIKIELMPTFIAFNFPTELGGGRIQYNFSEYEIISLLVNKINNDTKEGKNFVYAETSIDVGLCECYGAFDVVNPNEVYLFGGNSGLYYNKNLLFNSLEDSYSCIVGSNFDVIIPIDAFIDDVKPSQYIYGQTGYGSMLYSDDRDFLSLKYTDGRKISFYEQLLVFLTKQMSIGIISQGVMGFNKTYDKYLYSDETSYINYVENYIKENKSNKTLERYSGLISVVVGDIYVEYGLEISNGYIAYGSVITNTPLNETTTNKSLHQSMFIYNEFSNESLKKFSDIGCIVFRQSPMTGMCTVTSGVTLSMDSEFHFFKNVRSLQITSTFLKTQFDEYIGESARELYDKGIFQTNIDNLLQYLTEKGIITDNNVIIDYDGKEEVIYLIKIKTEYSTEFMTTSTKYKLQSSK